MKSVEYEMSIFEDENTSKSEHQRKSGVKKPMILLVEDNKELRLHLRNDLLNEYKVKEAKNGVDGIKMVINITPTLSLAIS